MCKAAIRRPLLLLPALLMLLTLLFLPQSLQLSEGQMLGSRDVRALVFHWNNMVRAAWQEGRLPFWDPYIFGGYPFFSNPQVGLFYPLGWLNILLPAHIGFTIYTILSIWIAAVGQLFFVRRMGGSWLGALLAAMAFAFGGFSAARVSYGHSIFITTVCWLPWMLMALEWSVQRAQWWAGMLAGIPVALAILGGHTGMLVYVLLIWAAFALYLGLTGSHGSRWQRWRAVAAAVLLSGSTGLLLSAVQTLPLLQALLASTRATGTFDDPRLRWSLPPLHLIAFLVPTYFGAPPTTPYWGAENFVELTYYVGILPLLCIPLAWRRRTRLTWFYGALMAFGLLAALGHHTPFFSWLTRCIILLRLGRAPARAAFLFVFAASALLGDTLTRWEREEHAAGTLKTRHVLLAVAALLFMWVGGAGAALLHHTDALRHFWHRAAGWAWAVALLGANAFLLWRYRATPPDAGAPRRRWGAALVLLLMLDLCAFAWPLATTSSTAPHPFWVEVQQAIAADPSAPDTSQRVLPWGIDLNIEMDAELVGLRNVFGYNSIEFATYRELTREQFDPRSPVYDVLGAAYVASPLPLRDDLLSGEQALTPVAAGKAAHIYRRARALPLVRLVYEAEVIADSIAAHARLHAPGFDPARTAVLAATPPCEVEPAPVSSATVRVLAERPGYWSLETESARPALLVLSELAYPGWRATVDGAPARIMTAYIALQAICVPAGRHRVVWEFQPVIFWWGAAISVVAALCVAVALVYFLARRFPNS